MCAASGRQERGPRSLYHNAMAAATAPSQPRPRTPKCTPISGTGFALPPGVTGRFLLLTCLTLMALPQPARADGDETSSPPAPRLLDSGTSARLGTPTHPDQPPGAAADELIRRLSERLGVPRLYNILLTDGRVRAAEGLAGVGLLAYASSRSSQRTPVLFVGVKALLLGFNPHVSAIEHRYAVDIEPEIGSRGFAVMVRRTLDP